MMSNTSAYTESFVHVLPIVYQPADNLFKTYLTYRTCTSVFARLFPFLAYADAICHCGKEVKCCQLKTVILLEYSCQTGLGRARPVSSTMVMLTTRDISHDPSMT